jgi:hypothetical protein
MFDFIKKLFGEGVVHFTFETVDGRGGKGKIPYIGEYDEAEIRLAIRKTLRVEHNVTVSNLEIVAHHTK